MPVEPMAIKICQITCFPTQALARNNFIRTTRVEHSGQKLSGFFQQTFLDMDIKSGHNHGLLYMPLLKSTQKKVELPSF